MARKYTTIFKYVNVLLDFVVLNILLYTFLWIISPYKASMSIPDYKVILLFFNLSWFYCSNILGIYNSILKLDAVPVLTGNIASLGLYSIFTINIKLILPKLHIYATPLLLFLFAFAASIILIRLFFLYIRKNRKNLFINTKSTVVVGASPAGIELYKLITSNPYLNLNVLGFFDDNNSPTSSDVKILGKVEESIEFAKRNNVHEIFCALPNSENSIVNKLMQQADQNLIRFRLVPDVKSFFDQNLKFELYEYMPVLIPRQEPLDNKANEVIKRAFDILFSSLVILFLLSWLTPLLAIIIKIDSKGPVFFRQLRSGKDNKPFYCFKFRSMAPNSNCDSLQASREDMRITKVGRFIRKTSIDELPQFFNVLLGDMSVVGPRPHMLKHTEDYSLIINNYMVRHFLTPGITGWAQVNGHRGETKETIAMIDRIQADIWYLEHWTILLDLKIVLLTIWQVIRYRENAY